MQVSSYNQKKCIFVICSFVNLEILGFLDKFLEFENVCVFRILGCHDMSRAREILSLNVVSSVGQCLHYDYEELLKSSAKLLATFSGMICTYEMATQIQVQLVISTF